MKEVHYVSKFKKYIPYAVVATMLLSPMSVFAADGDLWKDGKLEYPAKQIQITPSLQKMLTLTPNGYAYEIDGKAYNLTDVNAAYAANDNDLAATLVAVPTEYEAVIEDVTAEAELVVESVSAINANKIKVTFNQEVEELDKTDVTIQAGEEKLYVKSIKLEGAELEVELYDALVSGKTYEVTVAVGEETVAGTLEFTVAEVKTIELAAQKVKAAAGEKLAYKVFDANGLDVTAATEVDVVSDKAVFTASKGQVLVDGATLTSGASAFVKLQYKLDGKVVVESAQVKVTAEAPAAKTFGADWTLAATSGAVIDYENEDYTQDATLNLGTAEFINYTLVDQFGDDAAKGALTLTFESLDTSVAIVNATDGKVTPVKEGTVPVRMTLKDGTKTLDTKTVELTVAGKAKLADLEVKETVVEVTAGDAVGKVVRVNPLDQFENIITGITVTATSSKTDVASVGAKVNANGTTDIQIVGIAEGTATITVKAGEIEKTISVTVKKAGEVAGYQLDKTDFVNTIYYKADTAKEYKTETKIDVTAVDAAGLVVPGVDPAYSYEVKDKNGDVVAAATGSALADDATKIAITLANLQAEEGPFTLTVKVGSLTIAQETITVVDNRTAPAFTQTSNKITLSATTATGLETAFDAILDFGTTNNPLVTVDDVEFVSSNENIIVDAGVNSSTITNDGTTSIYVSTVTISFDHDGDGSTADEVYELDFKNAKFDIVVNAAETVALGTINSHLQSGNSGTAIAVSDASEQATAVDIFKDAGITGVTAANVEDVVGLLPTGKADGADLTKAEIQTLVSDAITVLAEVAKYEKTVVIPNTVEANTDITALVVALESGAFANQAVTVDVAETTDTGNLVTVASNKVTLDSVVAYTDGSTDGTFTLTLTLEKGDISEDVNVTVTVKEQPAP